MKRRLAGALALLCACDLEPRKIACDEIDACDCPATRLRPSGECCPVWTTFDPAGQCRPRHWLLPGAEDALGDPGARDVAVAVDGLGLAVMAWQVAADSAIHLQSADESSPGTWHLREPAAHLGLDSDFPTVVAGEDGAAVIAWRQGRGDPGAIFASQRDASGAWTDPPGEAAALSFPPRAYQPRLAENRSGEWLMVWNQWMTTPHYGVAVARRASPRDGWEGPSSADDVLSQPVWYSNTPVVAMNDAGAALIAWYQSPGGALMAYVSERPGPGAAFSRPAITDFISAPGGAVDSDPVASVKPAIAADGSAAVVWTQENGKGATLVYLATRDAGGRWSKPASLDEAFSSPVGYARGVQLAFGPRGDLYLTWYQDQGDGNAVYAARRRPDGTWAEDGRHALKLSSVGAVGIFPRLAVGPEGGVVVVWNERVGSGPTRVAARRTGTAGEAWGAVEMLSLDTGEEAVFPAAAMGKGDRAVVGWVQGPIPSGRVFVARME